MVQFFSLPQKTGRNNTYLCRRTEGAVKWKEPLETKQLFAFLMQRQVESIVNMSEMTVISSGPAGKAKNYFSLFPKEIALYYL